MIWGSAAQLGQQEDKLRLFGFTEAAHEHGNAEIMIWQHIIHKLPSLGRQANFLAPFIGLIDGHFRQSVTNHALDHSRNRRPGDTGPVGELRRT